MFSHITPPPSPPQRLQEQVNDVIDLHQNAVGELRGQLAQVDNMTVAKTQDLEDVVDEYQSKVGVVSPPDPRMCGQVMYSLVTTSG